MDWSDGPGTVAAVVAVLAMLGSFLGFVRTVGRQRKAGAAEERAVAAAGRAEEAEKRANEARDRAAAALEKLVEAQTPKPVVRWSDPVLEDGKQLWSVVNTGNTTARQAVLSGDGDGLLHPNERRPRDVDEGTGLKFVSFRNTVVHIDWVDPDGTAQHTTRRT